jgi:hypothetical protein
MAASSGQKKTGIKAMEVTSLKAPTGNANGASKALATDPPNNIDLLTSC